MKIPFVDTQHPICDICKKAKLKGTFEAMIIIQTPNNSENKSRVYRGVCFECVNKIKKSIDDIIK